MKQIYTFIVAGTKNDRWPPRPTVVSTVVAIGAFIFGKSWLSRGTEFAILISRGNKILNYIFILSSITATHSFIIYPSISIHLVLTILPCGHCSIPPAQWYSPRQNHRPRISYHRVFPPRNCFVGCTCPLPLTSGLW